MICFVKYLKLEKFNNTHIIQSTHLTNMSRKFLTRKMALPGSSVLNTDNHDHVVSITVVKPSNLLSGKDNNVESEPEWKPSVPHRPQPVHTIRRMSHVHHGSERVIVKVEQPTAGPDSPIEASTTPVYLASNRSAFTKPGYSVYNRSGKFIKFYAYILNNKLN